MLNKLNNPLQECDLKFAKDGGSFTGYASIFGSVDSDGDTVLKGAFTETLENRARPPLMLFGHNPGRPIGKWLALNEDDKGLSAKGEFTPGHRDAEDVRASMKHGAIDGLSIGFRIPAGGAEEKEGGGRIIKRVELIEISVVSMPAEGGARVDLSTVKQEIATIANLADAEAFLRDSGMWSRSMACAFVSQLKGVIHSDYEAFEKQIADMQQKLSAYEAREFLLSMCEKYQPRLIDT